MSLHSRREFLGEVGKGMLVASLGTGLAETLGVSAVHADDRPDCLSFGSLEPLVALIQETPADGILPLLVDRLRSGTELRDVVAAGALANARTFGGEDYVGFHAFMAMSPALQMARELPEERRALPVLKVLYRSSAQIQSKGGRTREVLRPVSDENVAGGDPACLRSVERAPDVEAAERALLAEVKRSPRAAFDALQALVHDDLDVHRVVLAYRSWGMLDLAGREHAHTLLRQSVRYCVNVEKQTRARNYPEPFIRTLLPRLIDKHGLEGRALGRKEADAAWIDRFALTLLGSTAEGAADAVAAVLAEGFDPRVVGEALSLAATEQVLRDTGRSGTQIQPGKPAGSVHGDSLGVHASDAMNAWRNIAEVSSDRTAILSLVSAAAHLARYENYTRHMAGRRPYPWPEHLEGVRGQSPQELLAETDAAIRAKDQFRTAALAHRYGELGHPARPMFHLLLRYATSEDGNLHAEKYYRTVSEEFGRSRKSLRWRHVVALSRVTASEYGVTAAGYEEACKLLKVRATPERTV